MSAINISFDQGDPLLDWLGLTAAFEAGHKRPKAEISDTFLYRGKDTLLSRAAWIDGLGIAVKAATIFPDNPSSGRPMINGGVNLFSDKTGALEAIIVIFPGVHARLVRFWYFPNFSCVARKICCRFWCKKA